MSAARPWLILAAIVLAATAAFHSTGLSMAAEWFAGPRGQIVQMLWLGPVIDWLVVSSIWLFAAVRPNRALAPVVALAAIVPAYTAVGLVVLIGLGHPGLYMLVAAIIFSLIGAWKLR